MPAVMQEIIIDATPDNIFYAITQQDELTRWWSNQAKTKPEVGTIAEIRFDNGEVMKMEIAELETGKKVFWIVREGPMNWEGTTISWEIATFKSEVMLRLTHYGFDTGCEQIQQGWNYFLGSLKSYLEIGKGTPYVN
jgi:uncharacterized protein YndB with AHSA1/START domain